MGRLIDVEKLLDVILEERKESFNFVNYSKQEQNVRFEAISDCIGIINHMPEYDEKTSREYLTVGECKGWLLRYSGAEIVMKRSDTGREYRKIKDALDEKNNWQVTGIYPRIKVDGVPYQTHAKVELVLWCRDRNADIKDLHRDLMCEVVCDKFGIKSEAARDI